MMQKLIFALALCLASPLVAQVTITDDDVGIGTTAPQFRLDVPEIGSSAGTVEMNDNVRIWGSLDILSGTLFSFQPELNINDNISVTGYVHLLPPGAQAGADSELIAGLADDSEDTYVRLDVEEDAPPDIDCDDEEHSGRTRVGRDPAGLYVCLDEAWMFVALAAVP